MVIQKQVRAESGLRKHGCVSEWPSWATNVSQEKTEEQWFKSCDAFNVK